jgi:hypothetical protein
MDLCVADDPELKFPYDYKITPQRSNSDRSILLNFCPILQKQSEILSGEAEVDMIYTTGRGGK